MKIEYEATFTNIDKNLIREKLKKIEAILVYKEFLQKRVTFNFPNGNEIEGGWIRVRQEADKITMSIKIINGNKIDDQKEINLKVDNFDEAVEFLETIGCVKKSYQENKRELWILNDTEITIDEWPFLEPLVEIEGKSEKDVKDISKKLDFNYDNAVFGCISLLYSRKYGISEEIINNKMPIITFENNPFLKLI